MKQLKLPRPIQKSKYIIGLVQGIPLHNCPIVKGQITKNHWTYRRNFQSYYFDCPVCKVSIKIKTDWSIGLHTRSAKCPKCNVKFCLVFENNPKWCEVCRVRKLDCLKKFILLAEVIK